MKAVRYSKQRQIILDDVRHRTDHPTVEMVYETVRHSVPNISLGTVYRNLNFLTDSGDLRRIDIGDGNVHFDNNDWAHMHFVCNNCHEIYDIALDDDLQHRLIQVPHEVTFIDVVLRGTCEACKKS